MFWQKTNKDSQNEVAALLTTVPIVMGYKKKKKKNKQWSKKSGLAKVCSGESAMKWILKNLPHGSHLELTIVHVYIYIYMYCIYNRYILYIYIYKEYQNKEY